MAVRARSVEPSEAIGIHFPLKLLRHFKLGLAAQFPGNNLAGSFANAVGDIVASDVEGFAVVGNTPNNDVGVRMAGVVMIDRDPVESCPEVGFHLLHQIAGGLARVGEVHAVLDRDDKAELMAVIAAPAEESTAMLHIALARIDLALRAILRHAVPFEVTQVRVHGPSADKLPSARGSALRVELHHPGPSPPPGRAKSTPSYAFCDFSKQAALLISLLRLRAASPSAGRDLHSPDGSMRSFAFRTGAVACSSSGS